MFATKGYATHGADQPLKPFSFERRDPTPRDVQIDILFCGICHTDIHFVRNELGNTIYPCVPGHEIVGRVVKVGREVKKFKEGDLAGVGCLVNTCRTCPSCEENLEQFCDDKVLGITTYSPLRHWKVTKGKKVGVVGLGGLGHMAVKIANAFGGEVTLFTTSPGKTADAKRLGAHDVVLSRDEDAMKQRAKSLDFIIDTVSAKHDLNAYLELLKRDGTLTQVGLPPEPLPVAAFPLIFYRRSLAGSLIGGLGETQEMLDFCAEHGITSDIELIAIDKINEAYERMLKSDVKYRFVIDMATLKGK